MTDYIRNYIQNRMHEMGFENGYHFYTERQVVDNERVSIDAHNEFWLLFDIDQLDDKFTITANNRILTSTDDFDMDGVPYVTQELTGRIFIDNIGSANPQTFLFYRIIPD